MLERVRAKLLLRLSLKLWPGRWQWRAAEAMREQVLLRRKLCGGARLVPLPSKAAAKFYVESPTSVRDAAVCLSFIQSRRKTIAVRAEELGYLQGGKQAITIIVHSL
jgi:hypothetical protein